jgi:hypothetical protein
VHSRKKQEKPIDLEVEKETIETKVGTVKIFDQSVLLPGTGKIAFFRQNVMPYGVHAGYIDVIVESINEAYEKGKRDTAMKVSQNLKNLLEGKIT